VLDTERTFAERRGDPLLVPGVGLRPGSVVLGQVDRTPVDPSFAHSRGDDLLIGHRLVRFVWLCHVPASSFEQVSARGRAGDRASVPAHVLLVRPRTSMTLPWWAADASASDAGWSPSSGVLYRAGGPTEGVHYSGTEGRSHRGSPFNWGTEGVIGYLGPEPPPGHSSLLGHSSFIAVFRLLGYSDYWGVPDQTLQAAPWLPVDSPKERCVYTAIASRADRSEEFPSSSEGSRSDRPPRLAQPGWERTRAGEPLVPVRGLKVPMTVELVELTGYPGLGRFHRAEQICAQLGRSKVRA
jgi:hypothetical protein